MLAVHTDPTKVHHAVLLFDGRFSNVNGDPDNGGKPRQEFDSGLGYATDASIKRKVRDYVTQVFPEKPGYNIYIKSGTALNSRIKDAAVQVLGQVPEGQALSRSDTVGVRRFLVAEYYDLRLFGGVLSTGLMKGAGSDGQLRGPVQISFAVSHDPISVIEVSITRQAVTRPEDLRGDEAATDNRPKKAQEMGNRPVVVYGLYEAHIYINPFDTKANGVSEQDLAVFWTGLVNGLNNTRSSACPERCVRGLYVFSHENPVGNAPAHELFERINISLNGNVTTPTNFKDYTITLQTDNLPAGVTFATLAD